MIHTAVFGTMLGTLAGLLWWADTRAGGISPRDALAAPVRAARWWAALARARHAARRDWVAGAELVAGLAAAAAVEQERPTCGRCKGTRCWYARNGLDCPSPRAPKLTDTLGGPGLHEAAAVLRRWVEPDWSPLPRQVRRGLAPTAWAARLGVPPIGVLP